MKEPKFYICRHCGNIVELIQDHGVPLYCCGTDMDLLIPNSTDASREKHIPVVRCLNGMLTVTVGAQCHPMIPEHYIQWIYVQTENGGMRRDLKPGDSPCATFCQCSDPVVAVYAYCNIHGLWMTKM